MSTSKRFKPEKKSHMPQRQHRPSIMLIDKRKGQLQLQDQTFQKAQKILKLPEMDPFPVPDEIALRIAFLLDVWDLCALACCSSSCKELCGSDYLWESLAIKRWSTLEFSNNTKSESSSSSAITRPKENGWRLCYEEIHKQKAAIAGQVIKYVENCSKHGSLEVAHYQKAIWDLHAMKFGFEDAVLFLLKPNLGVQVNLLGLHYCLNWIKVPTARVVKTLRRKKIAAREICVRWWTLGQWSSGYRIHMNDELHSHRCTLFNIVIGKTEEVLPVLYRGAVHEVLRVQITAPLSKPSAHSLHIS